VIVKTVSDVSRGDRVRITLARGGLQCRVEQIDE
jgi:exonuclease VII large subunit